MSQRFESAITFVVSVNNRAVLNANLLASPALRENDSHELIIQEGYPSAAKAYNDAIRRSKNDLMVFLHQDIYLPATWIQRLETCVAALERKDPKWGLAGCWGATADGNGWGYVHTPPYGVMGSKYDDPIEVQTLDEIVLVMLRSRGLKFDEQLPHYHFYGADLCLTARDRNLKAYAISAFCVHNANYIRIMPAEFYENYRFVKKKWKKFMPIQTPCIRISRFDNNLCERKVKEVYRKLRGRGIGQRRSDNPELLFRNAQSSNPPLL
jgi:hypothetical protein